MTWLICKYQGDYYQEVFGVVMIITNMFMEMFEIKALATTPIHPSFWGWYVDDTGTVQKKDHEETHINSQHESIAFTVEEQNSKGNLPMLDVMWRQEGDKIDTESPPTQITI